MVEPPRHGSDHLLDYNNWFVRRRVHRLFYLLHGCEYLALRLLSAAALFPPLPLIGITVGYASHMVGDYLVNARNWVAYSVVHWVGNEFRVRDIPPGHVHSRDAAALPEYRQVQSVRCTCGLFADLFASVGLSTRGGLTGDASVDCVWRAPKESAIVKEVKPIPR